MKIAIVTNKNLHHKYFASKLFNGCDVKLVIHPKPSKRLNVIERIKIKKLYKYGLLLLIAKYMSIGYNLINSGSMMKSLKRKEEVYFSEYVKEYNKIPSQCIHELNTVNSQEAVELVKSYDIDIIVFLGGDIAKKDFINSAKVCSLNYHSGVSPFYNGNKTIFHAVSDFRPNFAGGTLMYITEKIDGGRIISQYLPEIKEDDSAADIFMRNIEGAVQLYLDFFKHLDLTDKIPEGVKQNKSMKNLFNRDWNINNDLRLAYFEKSKRMKHYCRNSKIIKYYNLGCNDREQLYSNTLSTILG
jgi:folate-dependent phosphoribosylglycinamide formyltransferase PurN